MFAINNLNSKMITKSIIIGNLMHLKYAICILTIAIQQFPHVPMKVLLFRFIFNEVFKEVNDILTVY